MINTLRRNALKQAKALLSLAVGIGLVLGGNALPSQAAVTAINITADAVTQSAGSAVIPTLTASLSGSVATALNVTCNVYGNSDSAYATPLDQASLAVGTYKIHCTGVTTNAASYSVGTSTDAVLTVVANAALPCNADYYQMANGVLYKFNSPSFVYNSVSGANSFNISSNVVNSLAWDPEDNYLYGISNNSLYKIDNTGKSVPAPVSPSNVAVGTPIYTTSAGSSASNAPTRAGSTAATVGNTGGDFLKVGNSYYLVSASSTAIYVTDVRTRSLVKTITPTTAWKAYDITFVRNGSSSIGWGVQNETGNISRLYKATVSGTDIASLNITVSTTTLSSFIGSGTENYGAAYSDIDGNVYAYGNTSNKLYEIPKSELLNTNPAATLVTTNTTSLSSPNDGADCPNAASPTAATLTTSTPATSITSTSASVAGTVVTPNLPGANVTAGNLQFCYATSALLLSTTPNCVSATPSSTAQNTTPAATLSASLTGLTPSTTYYFQTKAVNAGGSTSYGEVRNFTTLGDWTLSANSQTYTIGSSAPTLGATASPAGGISGSPTCNVYASGDTGYATPLTISSLSAGTYVIHCTATSASGYTLSANNNGTLTVTNLLGWTITGATQSYQTPGTAPTAAGTASPQAGLSGSLSCAYYATTDTSYATPLTISNSTAPGTYVIRCTGTAASGYAAASINNGVLTVTQTPWYLNAGDATYTIGSTIPGLTASASIPAALSGSASCSVYANSDTSYRTALTLDATLPAGTYVIRCTGTSATGYAAPTINNGTLTVTSLNAWTLTAANANYTIGGTAPTLSATANPVGGLSGSATCRVYANSDSTYSTALTINSSLAAGTYVIRCTGAAAAGYAGATVVNGTLTVSAAAVTYSVTYNANNSTGGQVPTDSGSYNSGTSVTVKTNSGSLTRTGYTFGGWNTAADGSGTTYAATGAATFAIAANTTLYALWNIDSFVVTYEKNDGSSTSTTHSYNYGATNALSFANPWTRTGYTFVGWSTDHSATVADTSSNITGTTTLYAVWQANTYVLTFDQNAGGSATTTHSYSYGSTDALGFTNPWTRTGYTFLGWSTSSSSTSADTSYTVTGAATLYAVWQQDAPNTVAITYDKNDGSGTNNQANESIGSTTALNHPNTWTRSGYTFLGWATTSGATSPATSYTVSVAATLYAVWQVNTYVITYEKNDGSGTTTTHSYLYGATSALGFGNPWTRTGYTFLGWSHNSYASAADTSYTVSGDANLYAVWQANPYVITFAKNDGSGATTTHTFDYNETTALGFTNPWSRTGYTFLGWATTAAATSPATSYTVTGAATLYAVWQIDSYTITYDENAGGSNTTTHAYDYNTTNALGFANPWSRTGYTFLGWSINASAVAADTSFTVTGDATLYAIWQIKTYTVTYDKNDGSNTHQTQVYNHFATTALNYANPWTRTGYTFLGWSIDPTATAADVSYTVTATANLFAVWEINSYTITYESNDGSSNSATATKTHGSTNALSFANPWSRTGYTFLGWATTAGATSAATSFTVSGPATLYAVWKIDTFVITYDANDGSSRTHDETLDYGDANALAFSHPWNRSGYTFVGWSVNSSASSADSSYMVTAAGTLYAIWQQNPAGVFTVNYAKNDGSADNQDEDYTDGDTTALTFTNPFTRFGYTFLGWATTAGATSPATSYTVTADATLYAVWQVNSYTITYRLNDGSQTSATHAYNYGATNALSFVNPWTRDGFNFLGWSIDPNATEADASYTVTGDAELFAIWETAGPATVSGFPNRTKSVTLGFYALVAPTTNSPGAITYTATCAGVATVSGSMVTLLAAGTCQITATIAAAPGFAETTITMTLTITPAIVYIPVTPPSGNTPTVTPDSNANLTLEYKKPQGKVTLQSTNTTDPNENWTLNLQGTDPKGTPTPLNANKQLEFEDGNKVATHGEGFAPNTPVVVYIGGVKIGTVTTDSNGSFSGSFLIPQSVRPGVKIIQVNGITHGNTVRSVSLPIIIRKGGAGTIKKSVYFLGDSPKVTGHGGMVLQSILKLLRSKKNIVVNVSGWVKETADKSYDIKLSHDRAQNMVHVLRDIYKIKAKYSYKGYGISPEGTDKSRRADIVVTFTN